MIENRSNFRPLALAVPLLVVGLAALARGQPANPADAPAEAAIRIHVPADAEIFFDGKPTKQKGTERLFLSPPIKIGEKYHYDVVARWKENGKVVERKRRVGVTGGAAVRVDFLTPDPDIKENKAKLSEQEAFQLATEAYIYGYPLVTMEMTQRIMTNVAEPNGKLAPMGRFVNLRKYPDASDKAVTAPNADTLYSLAWLDLAKEPYILSIPDSKDRFYLMPMLDGFTNVFQVPGKRTTGTKAQKYALTGPGWKGELPEGVAEYKSPTRMMWILGRSYCTGTPEDYKAVHAFQDQLSVVPLSAYGKPYTPPPGKVDPAIDMKTPTREQVNRMDAATYFKLLAALLKDNPPAKADAPMVEKMAKIGIVPGKDFDLNKLEPAVVRGFQRAPKAGGEQIAGYFKKAGDEVNGWHIMRKIGVYGTDYLQRAFVTAIGLGANRPQDAVYPSSEVDADGKPYSGANNYVMHFAKGQTPPANAFWSLTMYDAQYFFVANPLNRHNLSPRNTLKYNEDGSLDLYLQKDSPGKDKESNWLPAPAGKFALMLRMYWPRESAIDGSWEPPAVRRMK